MKKITSSDVIHFAVSGTNQYVITPDGVLTSDFDAAIIESRLGTNVTIIDMEPDPIEIANGDSVREIAPETPVSEPLPEEVVAPEAPAEVVAPAEETAPEAVVEPAPETAVEPAPEAA